MKKAPLPLTPKEKKVLIFLEGYFTDEGTAPTFTEIKEHFGWSSYNSVQKFLKQLQRKNYIFLPGGNQKRAILLLQPSDIFSKSSFKTSAKAAGTVNGNIVKADFSKKKGLPSLSDQGATPISEVFSLPLLGEVAAGQPIESYIHDEYIDVPASLVKNPTKSYALKVSGSSMIGDGIFDGDFIFVQEKNYAQNGDMIVAMVNGEATVKRYYKNMEKKLIELRPSNPTMKSQWYKDSEVKITGLVVGLMRKFF